MSGAPVEARLRKGLEGPLSASSGRPLPPPDDLLERARQGDEQAWSMLYDELHRPLLGYLRGKGARDPEDVLGEVFLRLARSIDRFKGDLSDFRGYAFTIALNCVRDASRRRAVRPDTVFVAPDHVASERSASESAEDEALGGLSLDAYREGFAELTEDQRQVLYLRVVADLSIEETASIIGKSTGSVKQLHRRALERMRASLPEPAGGSER